VSTGQAPQPANKRRIADYFRLTTGAPGRGSGAQTLQFCAASPPNDVALIAWMTERSQMGQQPCPMIG
jgi:hypothetical protein